MFDAFLLGQLAIGLGVGLTYAVVAIGFTLIYRVLTAVNFAHGEVYTIGAFVTLIGTANTIVATQYYYREVNNLQSMPDPEFQKHIKKKLSQHLKKLFKAILTNED